MKNQLLRLTKIIAINLVVLLLGMILAGNDYRVYASDMPYTIIYEDNVISNMPADVNSSSLSDEVATSDNTPTRSNYKYLGWCSVIPTNNNGVDSCIGGTVYQPSANLTIDQTGTANDFHLYAMWAEPKTIATSTYLQEVEACPSTLKTGRTYTLKDSRDNTEYRVARLQDGKCWILDNLAIDITNSTILNGMDESNTNAKNTTLGYLKGTSTGTASDQYATAGVSNWTGNNYSYSEPLVSLSLKNSPSSGDQYVSVDTTSWKYGGFYNYCAASAGSYCYGNGFDPGTSGGDVAEDICPKGWQMPAGNTSGDFSALANAIYGSTGSTSDSTAYSNYRTSLLLPLSDLFINGSAYDQVTSGRFWSSTRNSDSEMYFLVISPNSINPSVDSGGRHFGYSVRCLLKS